jgi:integrin alpha FG-GAP repeat containing protein 1
MPSAVDRDGTIDMIFPTCSRVSSSTGAGTDCYINIAYNQQLPLCSLSTDSGFRKGVRICRTPGDLCIADPNFKFNLSDSPDNDVSYGPYSIILLRRLIPNFQNFVRFPTSSLFSSSSSLLVSDTTFNPPLPVALKLGDVNLDGFPDLLAITVAGRDQTPHLIYSVPCAANLVGCAKNGSGRRGWKVATKGVETLEAVKDARSVTFLDMDEDVGFIAFNK